jgi:S1-C subfamily serine protease
MKSLVLALVVVFSSFGYVFADNKIAQHLQDVSVTIKTDTGSGSGVIITRKVGDDNINFVWTAAHVVDGLRTTRKVVDPKTGQQKEVIEFKDAHVVKELTENGRRVGELKMDAQVIRFSDAENGEDLALLMVRKKNFVVANSKFSDIEVPEIGTELYHVGSLLGQMGANSMTAGMVSQVGRVLDNKIYDQTTCPAFPGSSGGGVFTTDGEYVGMLVRGAGETFNLIVPVRRLKQWAIDAKIEFAVDDTVKIDNLKDVLQLPVETVGVNSPSGHAPQSADKKPPVSK